MKSNSLTTRVFDTVFGYDFFISYAWKDGGAYAKSLHRKLTNQGFTVFLDRQDFVTGDNWSALARRAIRKTKQLIVVGTPCAQESKPVHEEIGSFLQTGRRVIPIELGDGLDPVRHASASLIILLPPEILRLKLDNGTVIPEEPSDAIVSELRRGFGHVRQTTFRMRLLVVTSLLLLGLSLAAIGFALSSRSNLKRALLGEGEARQQTTIAKANAAEAQIQQKHAETNAANAEEQRQRAVETLSKSDFETGTRLIEQGRATDGVPYLARAVRGWKKNRPAVIRLYNYIAGTGHLLPVCRPLRHQSEVVSASFSPDGELVLTGSRDGSAVLWKRDSGEKAQPALMHDGPVTAALFSPDGTRVLTTSEDMTARLWTTATGALANRLKHAKPLVAGAFSPNGNLVATAAADGTVKVWRVADGKPLAENGPGKVIGSVSSISFSPDNTRLVTVSREDGAQLWTFNNGLKLGPRISGVGYINSAVFSADSKYVLTAADDSSAQQWDVNTGRPFGKPFKHDSFVNAASYAPDKATIVTASAGGKMTFWNLKEAEVNAEVSPTGLEVRSAAFSPDGLWVVAADEAGTIKIYDATHGAEHGSALVHDAYVTSARFSNDGRYLVTASTDGTARIWHVRLQKMLPLTFRHDDTVTSVAFVPGENRLLTCPAGSEPHLWSLDTGKMVGKLVDPGASRKRGKTPAEQEMMRDVRLRPDGKAIVAISADGIARSWSGHDGSLLGPLFEGRSVSNVIMDDNGKTWATVSKQGSVQLWNPTGTIPVGGEIACRAENAEVGLSSSGRFLVVTRADDEQRMSSFELWDTGANKAVMQPTRLEGRVYDTGFSHDDRYFGVAFGSKVRIWNLPGGQDTGMQMVYRWNTDGPVFGRSSDVAITSSEDGTLSLWDVATGKAGKRLSFSFPVLKAIWFSNDELFATASWNNSGRIWHASSGLPLCNELRHEKKLKDDIVDKLGAGIFTFEWTGDRDNRPNRAYVSSAAGSPNQTRSGVFDVAVSDSQRFVATGGTDGAARVWEVIPAPEDPPDWLTRLAEGLVGRRLNDLNGMDPVSSEELIQVLDECKRLAGTEFWDSFGRWMAASPGQRTISPSSSILAYDALLNEAQWLASHKFDEKSKDLASQAVFLDPARPIELSKRYSLKETLSQELSNARVPDGMGFLFGDDHLIVLQAPKNWLLDNQVGRDSGIHAVFYPKDKTFQTAPAAIYVSVGPGRKQGLKGIAEEEVKTFKADGADWNFLKEEFDSQLIKKPNAVVYYKQSGRHHAFEKILYVAESPLLVKIVMTSQTEQALQSCEGEFAEFAQSYLMVTHQPSEAMLRALSEGNSEAFLKLIVPLLPSPDEKKAP